MEEPVKEHVLDIRSRESFLSLHHRAGASVPGHELEERVFELPPSPATLLVVCEKDDEVTGTAVTFLESKGFVISRKVTTEQLREAFGEEDLASGKAYTCLWRPNQALDKVFDRILQEVPADRRYCLDLAAGNGRDVVFCARYGFDCLGIDYQKRQWSKIDALAARAKDELPDAEAASFGEVKSSDLDLEKGGSVDEIMLKVLQLMEGRLCTLLIVSRYLYRPHFAHFHRLVDKGGLILFHTFMDGCQLVGKKTPTKERFLLKKGELQSALEEHFEVLEDSVVLLPDQRPTSCFLARRK